MEGGELEKFTRALDINRMSSGSSRRAGGFLTPHLEPSHQEIGQRRQANMLGSSLVNQFIQLCWVPLAEDVPVGVVMTISRPGQEEQYDLHQGCQSNEDHLLPDLNVSGPVRGATREN
jgi:hypothetical protein